MTLTKLLIGVAIAALILTVLIYTAAKKRNKPNLLITYLQNFTGSLFVFSGWVKAVDPLGTAYKMEQYFGEFQSTFADTAMSFIAPLFPLLSSYSIGFSVGMIVFEIVLGFMLILGAWPKLTSWLFFLLVLFFTALTGFTFLTGYVPGDVNFFEFGKWGAYVETNMKVTDCGCFGDFLKLKPKTTFLKDVFLLIPGIIFLFSYKQMHQLFSGIGRTAILGIATLGLFIYSLSNYVWDLPHKDFRPFKKGVNVAEQRDIELDAAASVQVLGYKLTNKSTGEQTEIAMADYATEYKNYPKAEWTYEQIRSKPTMEPTKISEFIIEHPEGYELTDDILQDESYSFMIVAHKLYADGSEYVSTSYADTTFVIDTLAVGDTTELVRRVASIQEKQRNKEVMHWNKDYINHWKEVVNPMLAEAEKAGIKAFAVTKPISPDQRADFVAATGSPYPFYSADDILLKTIVRSNPGIVLWKNGKIVDKWHYKKLPSFEKIKQQID